MTSAARLAVAVVLLAGGGQDVATKDFGPLYALYQQLEQDYVEGYEIHDTAQLDRQAAIAQHAVRLAHKLGNRDIVAGFARLASKMRKHEEAIELRDTFRALERALDRAGPFPRWPHTPPSAGRAKELFGSACAVCHGATGAGDGPAAARLKPSPENFLLADTVNPMSPWRAFVSIRWGVRGTAMPAFDVLSDEDVWSLAFYILTLRQPPCAGPAPTVSLRELATETDLALMGRFREAAMPCLRRGAGW